MFGHNFFGAEFYDNDYFAEGEGIPVVVATVDVFAPTRNEQRRKPAEKDWQELDRRKRELREEIALLFEPVGEAPPPASEPEVRQEIEEARADLLLVERAQDDGAIVQALAALESAVQNIAAARAEAKRLRDEEDDLELILLSM